jgi:hypothetical protein
MATLVNRDAPYSGLANLMALRGRMGDTELVHMSKPEVRGLASLGELTINPDTGLPEAFELKSILPTIAGIAAAYFTGGTSLLIPALATGATSAIVNKDVGRGLFDGLLSYAGGSIMQGLSGGEEFAKAAGAGAAGAGAGAGAGASATGAAAGAGATAAQQTAARAAGSTFTNAQLGMAQAGGAASPLTAVAPSTMASSFVPESVIGGAGQVIYGAAPVGSAIDPIRLAAATYGTPQSTLGSLTAGETAKFFAPQVALPIAGEALGAAMTPQVAPYPTLEEQQSTPYVPDGRTVTRVPLRSTPVTQEQALAAATGQTGPLRFFDYRYANKGGLVGLAEGGVPQIKKPTLQDYGDEISASPKVAEYASPNAIAGLASALMMGIANAPTSPLSVANYAAKIAGYQGLPESLTTGKNNMMGNIQTYSPSSGPTGFDVPSTVYGDIYGESTPFGSDTAAMAAANSIAADAAEAQAREDAFGSGMDSGFGDVGSGGYGDGISADSDNYQRGGLLSIDSNKFFEGMVPGSEHGMKDNVAFKVKGGNIDTAMLSPGEYVIPADVVAMLGNGNGDSGAKALDQFAKGIRQKAFGTKKQQKQLDARKELNKIMA